MRISGKEEGVRISGKEEGVRMSGKEEGVWTGRMAEGLRNESSKYERREGTEKFVCFNCVFRF